MTAGPDAAFPFTEVAVYWTTPVLHQLHASFGDAPAETIGRATVVGTFNGRPMTSSLRLKAHQGQLVAAVSLLPKAKAAA